MFIAALFKTIKKQKQCSLNGEWITKLQYIHTMNYSSTIKRTYTQQHSQITNALYAGLQQLKFCTSNARGEGTVTGWGTKISHAMWHGQEN